MKREGARVGGSSEVRKQPQRTRGHGYDPCTRALRAQQSPTLVAPGAGQEGGHASSRGAAWVANFLVGCRA